MTISDRIVQIQARLALDDGQCAGYLGVPVHTLINWRTGKRVPGAVVARLLDVLGLVEALNPALHAELLPAKG